MTTAVRSAAGRHLSSLRELRSHRDDACKASGYERMLRDYGVDVGAFSALVEHPRLIYAEQPGCWYYAEDLLRARLLRVLIDTGEFAPSSGVLSLSLDAFSDRGVKRWFNTFALLGEPGEVQLLGSTYRRRHRHLTYAALRVDLATRERLFTLFTTAANMLETARISPEAFAEYVKERFQNGIEPGLRPLLPPTSDRMSLLRFAESLRRFRLDDALRQLATPCCRLRSGCPEEPLHWNDFWNHVNGQFFGQPVQPLGPLYNRFLLTVADPVQLARALHRDLCRWCGWNAVHDISIAGLITEDDKYRMVHFDVAAERFYYRAGDGAHHPISWHEVRSQAEKCRTGGPCGVLTYLMMAAAGIYLVSDPVDGTSAFESAARTLHLRRLGLQFPSLAPEPLPSEVHGGFLHVFSACFDHHSRRALQRFLD